MKITVGFSKPRKFMIGAWAIEVWMRRPYCHAYIKLNVYGIDYVYEASHGSVHFAKYDEFIVGNEPVKEYQIEVSDEKFEKIKERCIALQGEEYSIFELAQIVFWDVCNNFGIKAATEDRKGYICSELVGRICADELGIQFEKPTYLLTPADVDNKLGELYG